MKFGVKLIFLSVFFFFHFIKSNADSFHQYQPMQIIQPAYRKKDNLFLQKTAQPFQTFLFNAAAVFQEKGAEAAKTHLPSLENETEVSAEDQALFFSLQGLIFYQEDRFAQACKNFQKALDASSNLSQNWRTTTLEYAAWSAYAAAFQNTENELPYLKFALRCFETLDHIKQTGELSPILRSLYGKLGKLATLPELREKSKSLEEQAQALLRDRSRFAGSGQDIRQSCSLARIIRLEKSHSSNEKAYKLLISSAKNPKIESGPCYTELQYLIADTTASLILSEPNDELLHKARQSWEKSLRLATNPRTRSWILFSRGMFFWRRGNYEDALPDLEAAAHDLPFPEPLQITAICAEKAGKYAKASQYRTAIWNKFPNSDLGPEAFFFTYPQSDYLNDVLPAIDHLRNMPALYPNHPYSVYALYLLGKHAAKQHPESAIEYFKQAVGLYRNCRSKGAVAAALSGNLQSIYLYSLLAEGNLLIQQHKRSTSKICIGIFEEILSSVAVLGQWTEEADCMIEEASFLLAQAYFEAGDAYAAEMCLLQLQENYERKKITRGHFLSRTWILTGKIAASNRNYEEALKCFSKAKDTAADGGLLTGDQIIELYLMESEAFLQLGCFDNAMLTLSKAINKNVISSLRLKAMYRRAEIYLLLGRFDQAQRQLETLAKKKGVWAVKASDKLQKNRKRQRRQKKGKNNESPYNLCGNLEL